TLRALFTALLTSFLVFGQSQNSSITGTVTDASGGAIPNAELTLNSLQRETTVKATTGQAGLFTFPNLEPGTYELKVTASGFRPAVVRPIAVTINQIVRNDVRLDVGTDVQTIEVQATAPQLNFENASRSEGVTPETLNELPLIVAG